MTSYGKSVRGKRAPPPLPMYERVTLKHVPTMVRRKYDHVDLLNLPDQQNEDASADKNEGESESEIDEFDSSEQGSASVDGGGGDQSDDDEHSDCILDNHVKDEAQENEHADPSDDLGSLETVESEDSDLDLSPNIEVEAVFSVESQHIGERNSADDCDTGAHSESLGNKNIQPTDTQLEYCESEDCGLKIVNHVSIVDGNLECEVEDKRLAEFSNELDTQLEYCESEDCGLKIVNHVSIVDGNLECEVEDKRLAEFSNELDLHSKYSGSEDDGPEVANHAPIVDSNDEDEIQDKRLIYLSNIHDLDSEDYKGEFDAVEDENPTSCANSSISTEAEEMGNESLDDQHNTPEQMHNDDYGHEVFVRNKSLNLRDLKNKGDGTEDMNGTIVDYPREAIESEEETHNLQSNEAPIVDSNLEDEIHDEILSDFSNLHGDSVDDNNGAEDVATPNYPTVRNALHYTEKISVHEQGLCSEDNKGEFGEVEDRNPTLCANDSVNNKAGGIKCGNVIDQKGTLMQACNEFGPDNVGQNSLHLMDLKINGDGTKDVNGIVDKYTREAAEVQEEAHRHYGEEQDFNPEAFKKTVKENGYELCCPYCKQCITNTLIYQRRENIQQNCRITCFTSILSLFCCIRD